MKALGHMFLFTCPLNKLGGHCPGNQGKVREFKLLSRSKSLTIPQVHSDDLSFYQNAVSRSQENFSEVREKSGKSQGR